MKVAIFAVIAHDCDQLASTNRAHCNNLRWMRFLTIVRNDNIRYGGNNSIATSKIPMRKLAQTVR